MERYASTLATTAACVGFLVAGRMVILHERASMPDEPVKVQRVAAPAETRMWADPPAKPELSAADTTGTVAWTASPPERTAAEPTVAAQPGIQAPVKHAALDQDKAKRVAEQARRRKFAQAKEERRLRTAARDLPRGPVSVAEETAPAEPVPARRVDPIGDLLRGLGIGRES